MYSILFDVEIKLGMWRWWGTFRRGWLLPCIQDHCIGGCFVAVKRRACNLLSTIDDGCITWVTAYCASIRPCNVHLRVIPRQCRDAAAVLVSETVCVW